MLVYMLICVHVQVPVLPTEDWYSGICIKYFILENSNNCLHKLAVLCHIRSVIGVKDRGDKAMEAIGVSLTFSRQLQ